MSIELYNKIGEELAEQFGATSGQMFGKLCLKLDKKAFAAFYKDDMVFKIGRDNAAELINKYSGAKNWDPSGKNRPMKDWVQVPVEYNVDWRDLARRTLEFFKSLK